VSLEQALQQVNATRDWSFASSGAFAGGEVGASGVIDGGGRRAVAKWEWPADPGAIVRLREASDIVERLRRRGALLPEYLAMEPIGDGVLVLQEFMLGAASDHIPATLIDDLVAHNELQAYLSGSGPGLERVPQGMARGWFGRLLPALVARAAQFGDAAPAEADP